MHGGKPKERVLDVVAGKNGDRPLGRQIALEQSGGDRAYARERLGVSQRAPVACCVALREKDAIRRRLRPMNEPFGDVSRIGRQRMRRTHEDDAVAAAFDQDILRPEPDLT